MQVHCGSLDLLGEVGVDSGFLLTFVLCLFEVSNFKEYDEDDFRDNFTVGVYNKIITNILILLYRSCHTIILTQHSLNCLASIGDVKFKPQVSLLCGSFQYAKHSEANPIFVPKNK